MYSNSVDVTQHETDMMRRKTERWSVGWLEILLFTINRLQWEVQRKLWWCRIQRWHESM